MSVSIVLVDDHQLVRDGFQKIIEMSDIFAVIGSFASAEDAFNSSVIKQADMLVTDISLDNGVDGFALIEQFKIINPSAHIIIVSMYESALYLQQAKKYEVSGFIHKREASELLIDALTAISQGEQFFSNDMAGKLSEAEHALEVFNRLYPRESEVFLLLAKGHQIKRIATDLNIAVKTVHAHRLNLYKKFGFSSSFEITKFCLKHWIVESGDF
jgi:two-component system, NarL family, response regulator FusR